MEATTTVWLNKPMAPQDAESVAVMRWAIEEDAAREGSLAGECFAAARAAGLSAEDTYVFLAYELLLRTAHEERPVRARISQRRVGNRRRLRRADDAEDVLARRSGPWIELEERPARPRHHAPAAAGVAPDPPAAIWAKKAFARWPTSLRERSSLCVASPHSWPKGSATLA